MTICYFGDYDQGYNRTRVLIQGLERAGATVIHCNVRGLNGLALYRALWKKHRQLRGDYDVLFVGLGNARLMPTFARLITSKPVVWEPLFALYDNWVFDRKYVQPHSFKAYKLWFVDWLGCMASDLIVLDVETHAKFFQKLFRLPSRKLAHALVGADTDIFFPQERTKGDRPFEVEFHGKYIPLHGADVIMRAAKLLEHEDMHFTMIGDGQDAAKTKQLAQELGLKNVTFLPFMPESEITTYIRDADVCTAMLGDVPRVTRSIPNKMYQAAAMARVSINADSTSLREVFTPGVDAVTARPGDPEDLARALRELKESGKAAEMGRAAYASFLQHATPEKIGAALIITLKERLGKKLKKPLINA
jgi:glycosyltransferase involved in cell wall biosynthesis